MYRLDVPGLSQLMAGHYYDAVAELPDVVPTELHARIVGWVRQSQPIKDGICGGCWPSILPGIPHDCGGLGIPSDEVRWRCVCAQPECMARQGRGVPTGSAPAVVRRRPRAHPDRLAARG
ncbi:hypothetical protein [Micromonospora craterilacus]|uniref:hypothetical protein n=1 Tax=Micromonospora craterilacus TaxID=1655439 RepID=UPI0011B4CAD1|nr:hypothetical protein [Micromonospora craterilacus]